MHKLEDMTMMKPTILLILAVLSGAADADDIYLTLGGWSKHFKSGYYNCEKQKIITAYNELTNIVTKECPKDKFNYNHNAFIVDYKGLTAGTFYNSYFKQTYLLGYTHRYKDFSIVAAYSKGYENTPGCLKFIKGCAIVSIGYSLPYHTKISYMGDSLALSFEFKMQL